MSIHSEGKSCSELDSSCLCSTALAPGCEGLLVQEHLQGNRTPHTDPLSRGVVSGLTLRHGTALQGETGRNRVECT
jgi:ribulose kinase